MASGSSRRTSRSSLPLYNNTQYHGGLAEDFINVQPMPIHDEKEGQDSESDYSATRSSANYMPPPFPPPGWHDDEEKETFWHRHRKVIKLATGMVFMVFVSTALLYPVFINRQTEDWTEEETPEISAKQLKFHVFLWLFISWTNLLLWWGLANLMPHVFRFFSGIFNPGQQKYWHILNFMIPAVTLLGAAIGNYVSYVILIFNNTSLLINAKTEKGDSELEKLLIKLLTRTTTFPSKRPWPRLLNELMTTLILWAGVYFFEKMLITFISIHYHYRSAGKRIESHKRMRHALNVLYEASTSLFPSFHEQFKLEDEIIARRKHKVHLLKSNRTSRTVDRALEDTRSSAALAKRIWLSLVPQGRDTLTVDDLVEVVKSHRRAEAEECFQAIDINQNGDLTLNEMVLTVMEMGRQRRSIFQGMMDIDRALNSFDWICVVVIASVIGSYLVLRYVRSLKSIKDAIGISLIGLSFGFGRAIFEFLQGCIFIFLKHAYDVGDRVEVYNVAATARTSVVVERISILYTVFRRIDNGKELQMSNERLNMKRIENVTRSGANREEISIFVDFNTTFQDIENLKGSLQKFVRSKENGRDYQPNVEIRLNNIYEMNKLELVCSFYHKSNWANEELRAARSSKFKCALLSVIRGMPLARPGALGGNPAQKEGFEQAREDAAYSNFTSVPVTSDITTEERLDGNMASGADIGNLVGYGTTGLRRRENNFSGGILYGAT